MIVCLAGMHRSGTSLMANYLERCGIHMGNRLVGPGKGNELGHFEDRDFLELHRRILKANRSGEMVPRRNLVVSVQDRRIAASLIEERREVRGDWGWKDPRTTLFLEFWHELVPDAHFILMYRDPYEVVRSIYRRMQRRYYLSPWMPFQAWIAYNEKIVEFAKRYREHATLVNIGGFNSGWEAGRDVLSTRIGVTLEERYDRIFRPNLMSTTERGEKNLAVRLYIGIGKKWFSRRLSEIYMDLEERAIICSSGPRES